MQKATDQNSESHRLIEHMTNAIRMAKLETNPFCHIYIQNIFPDDVYQQLLLQAPPETMFKDLPHKEAMRADGTSTRKVMPFNDDRLSQLNSDQHQFWLNLQSALNSEVLKNQVFDKLAPGIAHRMKISEEQALNLPAWPKNGYFRDLGGYQISPHRDVFTKIVTMQFYLPADDSQRNLGTALYTRDWVGRINRELKKVGLKNLREFTESKTFSFLPNSGYAFVVGNHSWHGRNAIPEDTKERRSLMNIYYLRPDVAFYED